MANDFVPLRRIKNQARVRDFLLLSCQEDHLSQAYLFTGPPGSGKHEVARALAQCVVCPSGGCGTCDDCIRVDHGTHPDVHFVEPAGASGYLVEQVREIIDDAPLTPIRGRSKVYVLGSCELLRGRSANALLKTIEEPPQATAFILIARTVDAVLPTLVSRCQQVPFQVLSPEVSMSRVREATGASDEDIRIALSVCHTPERAREFIASPARRQVRRLAIDALMELPADDAWDVLGAARTIAETVSSPFAEQREHAEVVSKEEAEYLSPRALKQLEQAMRRSLSARERQAMFEAIDAIVSVLTDVLSLACERTEIVNTDVAEGVFRLAKGVTVEAVLRALSATRDARADIARNVTPQLALEVMLLSIKEALECQK